MVRSSWNLGSIRYRQFSIDWHKKIPVVHVNEFGSTEFCLFFLSFWIGEITFFVQYLHIFRSIWCRKWVRFTHIGIINSSKFNLCFVWAAAVNIGIFFVCVLIFLWCFEIPKKKICIIHSRCIKRPTHFSYMQPNVPQTFHATFVKQIQKKTPRNQIWTAAVPYGTTQYQHKQHNKTKPRQFLMLIFVSINSSHKTNIFIFILLHFSRPFFFLCFWSYPDIKSSSFQHRIQTHIVYRYRWTKIFMLLPVAKRWNQHFSLIVSKMSSLMPHASQSELINRKQCICGLILAKIKSNINITKVYYLNSSKSANVQTKYKKKIRTKINHFTFAILVIAFQAKSSHQNLNELTKNR